MVLSGGDGENSSWGEARGSQLVGAFNHKTMVVGFRMLTRECPPEGPEEVDVVAVGLAGALVMI